MRPQSGIFLQLAASLALIFASGMATAQSPEPTGKPILTVSGKISSPDGTMKFKRDALEELGTVTIETNTPWYKGPVKFEGVPLDKLMQAVGATGDHVLVVAL